MCIKFDLCVQENVHKLDANLTQPLCFCVLTSFRVANCAAIISFILPESAAVLNCSSTPTNSSVLQSSTAFKPLSSANTLLQSLTVDCTLPSKLTLHYLTTVLADSNSAKMGFLSENNYLPNDK